MLEKPIVSWGKVINRIQSKDILPHKGAKAFLKKISDTNFEMIQTSTTQKFSIHLFPSSIARAMVNGSISKGLYDSIQYWLLDKYSTEAERDIDDLFELSLQILLLEIEKHQTNSVSRSSWISRMFSNDEKKRGRCRNHHTTT